MKFESKLSDMQAFRHEFSGFEFTGFDFIMQNSRKTST